jgi:predicted membrane channel-forming protein YqfA (hemolysin III family)
MEFNFKPDNFLVITSSLAYLLASYKLLNRNFRISLALIFIFLSSTFHHIWTDNQILRLMDWLIALLVILSTIYFAYKNSLLKSKFIFSGILLLTIWALSFYFFRTGNISIFTILHTFWHISTAAFIYLIFTKKIQ